MSPPLLRELWIADLRTCVGSDIEAHDLLAAQDKQSEAALVKAAAAAFTV